MVSASALVAVVLGSLGWALFHLDWAHTGAGAALLLYVALEFSKTPRAGQAMYGAGALATAAALFWQPQPGAVLAHAVLEAAFITGLFTSLSMLRDVAATSPLVKACGEAMVRQPPGRRYVVLCLGSHIIAQALNFGVLPLLGVMVVRGNTLEAADGDARVRDIRTRRMMTAILRGFALMTVWSPLSVAFAVTQGSMHGVSWLALLGVQLVLAFLLLGLGWLMDRLDFPPTAGRRRPETDRSEWRPIFSLCLLIAAIVVGAMTVSALLGVRMVIGAMMVVPLSALVWLMVQRGPSLRVAADFARRQGHTLPGFRYETAMLGGAMYLGTVVMAFISPDETARLLTTLPLPPIVMVILIAWSVMLLAQMGVSQIISVTLIGGALADLAKIGINPLVAASGLMGAWGLSASSTLVGAALLTVARMSGVSAATVARQWNGRFVLAGAALLAVWMLGLSWVLS